MSNGDDTALEDQIVSRFLENIGEAPEISAEVVGVVQDLAGEDDFGGRDFLEEQILEVKDVNED